MVATFPVRPSRGAAIVVVQTAEYGDGFDTAFGLGRPWNRLLLGEGLVGTRSVVEVDVLRHETPQVRFAQDQYVVE